MICRPYVAVIVVESAGKHTHAAKAARIKNNHLFFSQKDKHMVLFPKLLLTHVCMLKRQLPVKMRLYFLTKKLIAL